MRTSARTDDVSRSTRAPAAESSSHPSPTAAAALRLQRAVGNRAAGRLLARWAKHPDDKQKGVMVPDVVSEDFAHFNPPQNK